MSDTRRRSLRLPPAIEGFKDHHANQMDLITAVMGFLVRCSLEVEVKSNNCC